MRILLSVLLLVGLAAGGQTLFGQAGMPDPWELISIVLSGYLDVDSTDTEHLVVNVDATIDSLAVVHVTGVTTWVGSNAIMSAIDSLTAVHGQFTDVDVSDSLRCVTVDATGLIYTTGNMQARGANASFTAQADAAGDYIRMVVLSAGGFSQLIAANQLIGIQILAGPGDTLQWGDGDEIAHFEALENIFDHEITIPEITTPTALASSGKLYTKTDNQLYFQSGDGIEHLVTLGASDYGEMGNVYGSSATEVIHSADEWHGMFHANITGSAPHLNSGFAFTAGSEGAGNITTAQAGAGINIADAAHGLVNGDIICVQSANHVGVDTVTYVDAGNFEVTIAYVGDEAATWQEGSYLEVATTGTYRGAWNASFSQSDNATRANIVSPFVNTTQSTKATATRVLDNNTDIGSIGGNGLMSFTAGDRIWFGCQSADPQTLTFTIRNVTIH